MKISFGICLGPKYNEEWFIRLVNSIANQYKGKPKDYEVIVIGGYHDIISKDVQALLGTEIIHIAFDEFTKPGHITKKKNILADMAYFENLVIVHDYFKFSDGWLNGVIAYNNMYPNWKVLMNRVENLEGTRHGDWTVNPNRMQEVIDTNPEFYTNMLMKVAPHENAAKYVAGLPYGVNDLSHIQYISGGYIFCKAEVIQKYPLDENRSWGQEEDVEWSERLNKAGILFHFNPYSVTTIQKPSKWYMSQMPYEFITALRNHYGSTKG